MKILTAQQLRNFLNEIEADGNDLSTIEINFREHDDSDVTPIGYVFEDLHDDDNKNITSIVFNPSNYTAYKRTTRALPREHTNMLKS